MGPESSSGYTPPEAMGEIPPEASMAKLEEEAAEDETIAYSPEQAAEILGEGRESIESMIDRQARVWVKTTSIEGGMFRGNVLAGSHGGVAVEIRNPQDPNHAVFEDVTEKDLYAQQEEGMRIELDQIIREGHEVWVERSDGEFVNAIVRSVDDDGVNVLYEADEAAPGVARKAISLQEFAAMQNKGLAKMYKEKSVPIKVERGDRGSKKFQEGRVYRIDEGLVTVAFEDSKQGGGWATKNVKLETMLDWQEEAPKQ